MIFTNTSISHSYSAPQVRFMNTAYSTSEGDTLLNVCVQLAGGPLSASGQVQILSQSGSAMGE